MRVPYDKQKLNEVFAKHGVKTIPTLKVFSNSGVLSYNFKSEVSEAVRDGKSEELVTKYLIEARNSLLLVHNDLE